MTIWREYTFDAAHALLQLPHWHKCRNVHGHTYTVRVEVTGGVNPTLGWVIDYSEMDVVVKPVLTDLDHHNLNDVPGLEVPTAEHIAKLIWRRIKNRIAGLSAVEVCETAKSGVRYTGDGE